MAHRSQPTHISFHYSYSWIVFTPKYPLKGMKTLFCVFPYNIKLFTEFFRPQPSKIVCHFSPTQTKDLQWTVFLPEVT